jgi:arylsulfatase A-like enzyme
MIWSLLLGCFPSDPPPPPVPDTLTVRRVEQPVRSPAVGHPNVVLLIGCTVRRDQIGAYGGPSGVTPFLDDLATTGVRMADPIAGAAWTRAASTVLVTGRYPLELGLVDLDEGRNDRPLPAAADTLAERFHAAGYRTLGATANPNLNGVFGFDQGFSTYVEPARLWRHEGTKVTGRELVPRVLAEAGDATEQPLFLQVMLVDAHAPFPRAQERFADAPSREVQRYRGALHGLDRAFGALSAGLQAHGYTDDNTLFVVVSDHGEGLSHPEHHGRSHGRYLYGSAVEALWMLRGPGLTPGHTVPGAVSMADLAPTLAGLAGVEASFPGTDLSPLIRDAGPAVRSSAVADSWFRGSNRAALYTDRFACMRSFHTDRAEPDAPTGRFVPGCYDRTADPLFLRPLEAPLPPEAMAAMAQVTAWRAARPLGGVQADVPVSTELAGQLEALGYAE